MDENDKDHTKIIIPPPSQSKRLERIRGPSIINKGKKKGCNFNFVKCILILMLLCAFVFFIYYFSYLDDYLNKFLDWLQDNPLMGTVYLILIYIAVNILLIP